MPIDMRRPLLAAIQAALEEVQAEPPKKRHGVGAGRALLLGAGLYTAGRVVTKGHVKGMLEAIQQRLPEQDDTGDHGDEAQDEFDEEEPQDEFDEEAPQAEAEEDAPADEEEGEEPADEDEPVNDAEDERQRLPRT